MFDYLMEENDVAALIAPENMSVQLGARNQPKNTIRLLLYPHGVYQTLDAAGIPRPKEFPFISLNLTKALSENIQGRGIYPVLGPDQNMTDYYLELLGTGTLVVHYSMITGSWTIGVLKQEQIDAVLESFCIETRKAIGIAA